MDDQVLNLRGSLQVVRRYLRVVLALMLLGVALGLGYAFAVHATTSATSLVLLPASPIDSAGQPTRDVATVVEITLSPTVLVVGAEKAGVVSSYATLQRRVFVTALTTDVIQITALAPDAHQAERLANAVAARLVAYSVAGSPGSESVGTGTYVLEHAATTIGPSSLRTPEFAALGGFVGLVLGSIGALLAGRRDRRLFRRDEISAAARAPVLAMLSTPRRKTAADWSSLFEKWKPSVADKMHLRRVLDDVGVPDAVARFQSFTRLPSSDEGSEPWLLDEPDFDITVIVLAGDQRALAVAPELASFAAGFGLPVAFVVGTDDETTPKLRSACASQTPRPRRPRQNLAIYDHLVDPKPDGFALIVTLVVVDPTTVDPADHGWSRSAARTRSAATILAVSSGFAMADALAVAGDVARQFHQPLTGVVVTNPDPADRTSGKLPRGAAPRAPERTSAMRTVASNGLAATAESSGSQPKRLRT